MKVGNWRWVYLSVAFWAWGNLSAYADPKEWTLLVYLDGNNSLDAEGPATLQQLETIGSTPDINLVVQWASAATKSTKRLLLQKSTDPSKVTSPVLEEFGTTDMGDYHTLVDFVGWASVRFPAKHYFLVLWDHGSGWHDTSAVFPSHLDIGFDDLSGHAISTLQTGVAMAQIAQIIGHKLDLLANDACLMAMVEIANEVSDSVEVYAGSEELEPDSGWPYDKILARWVARPNMSAADLARIIAEEYVGLYQVDGKDSDDATYSAFDLSHIGDLDKSVAALAGRFSKLSGAEIQGFQKAVSQTQNFDEGDYLDLGDLGSQIASQHLASIPDDLIDGIRQAVSSFVIESHGTSRYANATGVSIWIPQDRDSYDHFMPLYRQLKFEAQTSWGTAMAGLVHVAP